MAGHSSHVCNPELHEVIDMGEGKPDKKQLESVGRLFQSALDSFQDDPEGPLYFQYGARVGSCVYREELAKFLTEEYGSSVDSEDLVLTASASQGLHLLGTLFFEAGDLVFVEELTYFCVFDMLAQDCHMNIVSVAMDKHGMIPQSLEQALRDNSGGIPQVITEDKPYWAMLYTVPTFHNPTGKLMPPDRAREIVAIARQYNLLVVCDDVYNLLYFTSPEKDTKSPSRIFALDDKADPDYKGSVVSNGTFSKLLAPGLRLGWMEAPQYIVRKIDRSGYATSGGGFNHTMSHVVASIIRAGLLKPHVESTRRELQKRCDVLCDVLRKELPSSVTFEKPKGGYYVWLTLPEDVDNRDVLKLCQKNHQVEFLGGEMFSAERKFSHCLRLSFSTVETQSLLIRAGRAVADSIKRALHADPNTPCGDV